MDYCAAGCALISRTSRLREGLGWWALLLRESLSKTDEFNEFDKFDKFGVVVVTLDQIHSPNPRRKMQKRPQPKRNTYVFLFYWINSKKYYIIYIMERITFERSGARTYINSLALVISPILIILYNFISVKSLLSCKAKHIKILAHS